MKKEQDDQLGHQVKTFQSLGIFWPSRDGGDEVQGIYIYAYWGTTIRPTHFDALRQAWQNVDSDISHSPIDAEQGAFVVVRIRIHKWPTDTVWHSAIEESLTEMVRLDAKLAWCGGEYCSWSLAEFDPATTSGCIYAAHTSKTGLILHSELYEEILFLSDEDLQLLKP